MKPHLTLLKNLNACIEAIEFAETCPNLRRAWETCNRPDWMLWLANRLGFKDLKTLRLYACWCVRNTPLADGRTVWDLLTDPRSRNAVEVSERFANGDATEGELAAAEDAALEATWDAAWEATEDAALDAAEDAAFYATEDTALDAAEDAALEAVRAAARAAAWDAARDATWNAQSARLRELIPYSTISKLVAAYNRKRKVA
jgi:hypothetical protein